MDYLDIYLKPNIENYLSEVLSALTNEQTLQLAKESVPIANIVQDHLDIIEKEGDFNENFLPHLVEWFANDFFSWFSPPNCGQCQKKLEFAHASRNIENLMVENYKCVDDSRCKQSNYQFIRHNDPAILLNTRQGRCGEWAMCFLVILKALDYDARIVLDTTDHVWNEVWSETKQKWLHVDPCESVVDMPLLYEVGWKKKLKYCIGLSNLEVTDVTARYTKDFSQTIAYRPYCDIRALQTYLDRLTENLLESIPDKGVKLNVSKRRSLDLAYLSEVSSRPQSINNLECHGGRKTGSIQWRIERGEYNPIIDKKYVIKVGCWKNSQDGFCIKYNCDRNTYEGTREDLGVKSWTSLIYHAENVDFKYERDWKCSYLARYETCPPSKIGKIHWRFDITAIKDLDTWTTVKVNISGKVYPDTSIAIQLIILDKSSKHLSTYPIELNKQNVVRRGDLQLNHCHYIQIEASLEGGDPDDSVAWQKPQLFRQTRSQESNYEWPFMVEFL